MKTTIDELDTQDKSDGVEQQVVGALIEHAGRVLLLHRRIDDFRGDTWELPSGKVEASESLHEALRREVAEETGLAIEAIGAYLGAFDYASGSGKFTRQHTWVVTTAANDIALTEHDAYAWATPGDKPVSSEVEALIASLLSETS